MNLTLAFFLFALIANPAHSQNWTGKTQAIIVSGKNPVLCSCASWEGAPLECQIFWMKKPNRNGRFDGITFGAWENIGTIWVHSQKAKELLPLVTKANLDACNAKRTWLRWDENDEKKVIYSYATNPQKKARMYP